MLEQDFGGANHALTRAVECMPKHIGSWHVLGWMHLVRGELDQAQPIFETALELNRNFSESHGALASIAALRGETARAREMIKIAMRLDPECMSARFAQSVLSFNSGDRARAQQVIGETMLKIASTETESYRRIFETAMKNRKLH